MHPLTVTRYKHGEENLSFQSLQGQANIEKLHFPPKKRRRKTIAVRTEDHHSNEPSYSVHLGAAPFAHSSLASLQSNVTNDNLAN